MVLNFEAALPQGLGVCGAGGTTTRQKRQGREVPPLLHALEANAYGVADAYALKKFFNLSAQPSSLGECLEPPFFSDSSSSLSSLRWCSVNLTGVSTLMWQYRSPG